jgi:hypothetical protein
MTWYILSNFGEPTMKNTRNMRSSDRNKQMVAMQFLAAHENLLAMDANANATIDRSVELAQFAADVDLAIKGVAPKSVASCAVSARARGRFDAQTRAANDAWWRAAA